MYFNLLHVLHISYLIIIKTGIIFVFRFFFFFFFNRIDPDLH